MSYESEMVGQKPGKKGSNNYEGEMMGEKMKKAPSKTIGTAKDGTTFKKGGAVKKAMGGVGKMRHDEADSKGMPKSKRHPQKM